MYVPNTYNMMVDAVQGAQDVFKQLPVEMVSPSQLPSVVESGGTHRT
jgi:hypothetical protein